ncbi:MAG: tetratricopeptide (TPR) repeat protein, partial [Pirellulaceae bacterium]
MSSQTILPRPGATVRLVIALALITAVGSACEWDYDTLKMEQQRFPNALELISGKFLRHGQEFYQWRIQDRKSRLTADPTDLKLYDDLAVAYDKTGQQSLAIETILKKDALQPGEYETYANLGTFHIHAGNLAAGVEHLKRAIEINPAAHFGREIYQQLLVEYVLSKQVDGVTPLPLVGDKFAPYTSSFAEFVFKARKTPDTPEARTTETEAALKGILGMMRFGNYRSPILLEAAGDLLRADWNKDAKRLAARAYLKASQETADQPAVSAAYLKMAKSSLSMQTVAAQTSNQLPFKTLAASFSKELKEAAAWYAKVRANELKWIKFGVQVDEAFDKEYYTNGQVNLDTNQNELKPKDTGQV